MDVSITDFTKTLSSRDGASLTAMYVIFRYETWGPFADVSKCCGYYALTCCGMQWIIQMMQRGEIRKKYGLKGNGCTDCLCA
jgi:hypothetical protein